MIVEHSRGGGPGEGRDGIQLFLLDGFELRHGNRPAPALALAVQRVIAFLALRERPIHRTHVAASLWPDTTENKARANLRSAVWRLGMTGLDLLEITTSHMRVASRVWVDVRQGVEQARRLVDPADECRDVTLRNFALNGELLSDWYDDWVLMERERLRQLRLHALESLCDRLSGEGRHGESVDAGLVAISSEPLRESAQAALIRAYLREGNRVDARRQYDRYRALLLDELGVTPGPVLEALVHDG